MVIFITHPHPGARGLEILPLRFAKGFEGGGTEGPGPSAPAASVPPGTKGFQPPSFQSHLPEMRML